MTNTNNDRILFIDLGRTIAICMMLQGHFVTTALAPEFKDSANTAYYIFAHLRGLTAPLFFTITGVVFAYLLSADLNKTLRESTRLKKGIKRVLLLLLWAYLLQFNFVNFFNKFRGFDIEWARLSNDYHYNVFAYLLEKNGLGVYGFHVLHCIGIGILFLIIIFLIARKLKFLSLASWYFLFAFMILVLHSILIYTIPKGSYFPENAPMFIQNMFIGKYSVFPIIPYLSFVMMGGMFGAIIAKKKREVFKPRFFLSLIIFGILLILFNFQFRTDLDDLLNKYNIVNGPFFEKSSLILGRAGQVCIVLALLIFVEYKNWLKDNWVLQIGKNTFPVFVLHAIILYGSTIGIGLDTFYKSTNYAFLRQPATVIICAALFIGLFMFLSVHIEKVDKFYQKIVNFAFLNKLKNKPNYFHYFFVAFLGMFLLGWIIHYIK